MPVVGQGKTVLASEPGTVVVLPRGSAAGRVERGPAPTRFRRQVIEACGSGRSGILSRPTCACSALPGAVRRPGRGRRVAADRCLLPGLPPPAPEHPRSRPRVGGQAPLGTLRRRAGVCLVPPGRVGSLRPVGPRVVAPEGHRFPPRAPPGGPHGCRPRAVGRDVDLRRSWRPALRGPFSTVGRQAVLP